MRTNTYRRLANEGAWLVLGQLSFIVATLVLIRTLTERLSPVEYGNLALALTLSSLVSQVVFGGIGGGITRFYSVACEYGDLHGFLRQSFLLMLYGTVAVVAAAALPLLGLIAFSQWELVCLAAVALLFSCIDSYNNAISGIQNAARRRVTVALHMGISIWLRVALAAFAMRLFGFSSVPVITGYILAAMLITASQIVFLRVQLKGRTGASERQHNWQAQIWQYSWPFMAWGFFTWLQQASDRWSLKAFSDPESVGLYIAVYQIGYAPISIALGVVTTFLGPILFEKSGDASNISRKLTWLALFTTILVAIATMFFHEQLFGILVAADYLKASYLLPWVVLGGGLFATGQMLALKLMSELRSRKLLVPKITTAALGIVFNIIGASVAGINGVVLALVAFSAVYMLWMMVLGVSQLPRKEAVVQKV